MKLNRKYIALDVEASGPSPGEYSLLSIGACVVGDLSRQFYREIKPLNSEFQLDAMRIGCLGLKCIDVSKPEFNPKSEHFSAEAVLQTLEQKGATPQQAFSDLRSWTLEQTVGYEPILLTDIQPFDGMFVMWYFSKFVSHEENPFGYKGLNLDVLYQGITGKMGAKLRDLGLEDDRQTPHNALDDALLLAKRAEQVFSLMATV